MKKACIILLIIMLISFIVAGILVAILIQNSDELERKTTNVEQSEEVSISSKLNCIQINSYLVENLNVIPSDTDKVVIELTGTYQSIMNRELKIYVNNGTNRLDISVKSKGLLGYFSFGDYSNDLTLNVYIPTSYKEEIRIDEYNSNVYIEKSILEDTIVKFSDDYYDEYEYYDEDYDDYIENELEYNRYRSGNYVNNHI